MKQINGKNCMNYEQKKVFGKVKDALENNKQICIFINGPAGTGKTFVYTAIYHLIRSMKKSSIQGAWSGIAAQLLPEGRTIHSIFKLPVPLYSDSVSGVTPKDKFGKAFMAADVYIWDEAPMAPRHA